MHNVRLWITLRMRKRQSSDGVCHGSFALLYLPVLFLAVSGSTCDLSLPTPLGGQATDGGASSQIEGVWRGIANRTGSLSGPASGGAFNVDLLPESSAIEMRVTSTTKPESLIVNVPFSASSGHGLFVSVHLPALDVGQSMTNSETIPIGYAGTSDPNGNITSQTTLYGRLDSILTLKQADVGATGFHLVYDISASITPDPDTSWGFPAIATTGTATCDVQLNGDKLDYTLVLDNQISAQGTVAGSFHTSEHAQLSNGTEYDVADSDGDGIRNVDDNCPGLANPDQTDADTNGVGEACQHAFYNAEVTSMASYAQQIGG